MTVIEAPVSGVVAKVLAKVGDVVAVGDVLLIIEAMKLEIPISAEAQGTVKAVEVAEGELVDEGRELIHLSA